MILLEEDELEIPAVEAEIVADTDIEPEGPEQGEDTGIANIIHDLIIDENEAIQGYNNAAANMEKYPDLQKIMNDIAGEEFAHIGELQKALEIISPNASKIADGEVETEENLDSTQIDESLNESIIDDKKAQLLVDWYTKHNNLDDQNTISIDTAKEILRMTFTYGYKIFDIAYDIVMGDVTELSQINESSENMSDDAVLNEIAGTLNVDTATLKSDVKSGRGKKYAAQVQAKCCDNCKARFKQMIGESLNESAKIISPRHRESKIDFKKFYHLKGEPDQYCGYSFPCDEQGNLQIDNDGMKKSVEYVEANPDKYDKPRIEKEEYSWMENAHAICSKCGEEFELWDQDLGACECPNCGQWYNIWGQELNPRDTWSNGEDW